MRLIFCLNGPNELNGPNVWLTRHLPLLSKNGFFVEILYLSQYPEVPCIYRSFFENLGMKIHTVVMNGFVEDKAQAIVEALATDPPDVFVPNYSVPAYFASRFLRESGVFTIGTLHSDDPYYHDIIDFFIAGDTKWQLSGVVGVSEFISQLMNDNHPRTIPYLHASYGAPVPNLKARRDNDSFTMVYSGRLVEFQKRISRVTRAMLTSVELNPGVEGVIYGGGSDQKNVADILARSEYGSKIKIGGTLNFTQIQSALTECHVFVLLSDFEGLSIALMEAMACGLVPVIANMQSGANDLINSGENGFIIDAEDPEAFSNAIKTLYADKELWEKMSQAARDTIIQRRYTPEDCAEKWSDFIYQNLQKNTTKPISKLIPKEVWDMPPESKRLDGIRPVDKRSIATKLLSLKLLNRPIFLWGASKAGKEFLNSANSIELPIVGFIDSDRQKHGTKVEGIAVHHPSVLHKPFNGCKIFVIITSIYAREISSLLEEKGYHQEFDFI